MKHFFAAVLIILLPLSHAWADLTEPETLRGLDRVQLVVEALHPDAHRINLTREQIEQDVRAKFEAAGIDTLTLEQRMADERRPYLYINCNIMYVENIQLTSFSIDVEVHQRATLADGEQAQALTWAKSYLGIQGKDNAAAKIRGVISSYVDLFTDAVNAPDSESQEEDSDEA